MSEKVRLERRENGVRLLTLIDPDKRNAIGPEMRAQLADLAAELARDEEARALVITGEGSAFCAGADLPAVFGDQGQPVDAVRARLRRYYDGFLALRTMAMPTIAAVQGAAIGAGLNLALCCDVRLASPAARFGATFSRIGLHPGGGCTWFLVQALGPQRALRVLLRGETLDAQAAVENGLADRVVEDPVAAALELAGEIAETDPILARNIKRAVRIAVDDGFDATLEFEAWAQAATAAKPEIRAVVERFSR